jgi:TIR domain
MPEPKPVPLFFCYAPEDEALRQELEKHLTLLQRGGYITSWSGRSIGVGEDWRAEIERRMAEARVILLLVSVDFVASDYLYEVELERALDRRASAREEVLVLGVLLRPTDWKHGKLTTVEMLPLQGREPLAVTSWSSHDAAFERVAQDLRPRLYSVTGRLSGHGISINPSEAHPPSAPPG